MTEKLDRLKEQIGNLPSVDTVFTANGESYIDTAVSVMRVYDLIEEAKKSKKEK